MIDHLGLQAADAEAAAAFYVRVFSSCGIRDAMRYDTPNGPVIGMSGPAGHPQRGVRPMEGTGRRPVHLALRAPSRDAVDAVCAAARDAGSEILHEPRVWPEYHPGYYGVFFRDPDGNNVEAVHHAPPPAEPGM